MKLRELAEKHGRMEFYIKFCGATKEVARQIDNFYAVLREHYTHFEAGNPEFMNREVPRDVEEAFNKPFDAYRRAYRGKMRRS